ncbi:MAG: hypothetical protein JW760_06580, partial [Spirochaetales bacterium]|nr:hypothetical protein [Spirochaetales bacterium]
GRDPLLRAIFFDGHTLDIKIDYSRHHENGKIGYTRHIDSLTHFLYTHRYDTNHLMERKRYPGG